MKTLAILLLSLACTSGCTAVSLLAPWPEAWETTWLEDRLDDAAVRLGLEPSMKRRYHIRLEEFRKEEALKNATTICEQFGTTTVCRPNTPAAPRQE